MRTSLEVMRLHASGELGNYAEANRDLLVAADSTVAGICIFQEKIAAQTLEAFSVLTSKSSEPSPNLRNRNNAQRPGPLRNTIVK